MNKDFLITLCGYTKNTNTCYYPWKKFFEIIKSHLGYDVEWIEAKDIKPKKKRRVFICWNMPDADGIVNAGLYKSGDIILQKVTTLGNRDKGVNWGKDAKSFLDSYKWTQYKMVEEHYDAGINIYAFGCRTDESIFPEKKRIYDKLKERWFWIPWGSSLYSWNEIQNANPVMDGFLYDVGYVGSVWGRVGRGNIDSWEAYMKPILNESKNPYLAGRVGMPNGPASDPEHKRILKHSRLCPIINAPTWRAELGMQDRFWTVFTSGRFGVVDTEGVYLFFDEDEVVCATDPEEYVEKSLYYMNNVEAQKPFIEKVLTKIKTKYNYYYTWQHILESID